MAKKYPPRDQLLKAFSYDELTGVIRRKSTSAHNAKAGHPAGYINETGYVYIKVRSYGILRAHRIAWIMVHGDIPEGMQIDHIDGVRSNNAISNLRLATISQNGANRCANSNRPPHLKGCFYQPACGRWKVQIKVAGKLNYIGMYDTADEATGAYKRAATEHFGEYAR